MTQHNTLYPLTKKAHLRRLEFGDNPSLSCRIRRPSRHIAATLSLLLMLMMLGQYGRASTLVDDHADETAQQCDDCGEESGCAGDACDDACLCCPTLGPFIVVVDTIAPSTFALPGYPSLQVPSTRSSACVVDHPPCRLS